VPIRDLNELEFIRGEIYANVWHTDRIARISPQSGRVLGWIDLRGLLSAGYVLDPEAVLNGIAYDATRNRLFVTGKLWPRLFEIQVVPRK
jgi:glutamine cyclotransferase